METGGPLFKPKYAIVQYRGIPHKLDLVKCRLALVHSQVQGRVDSMESLADRVDISRSTASRFFSGRPTSLAVTLLILGLLGLSFDDVTTSLTEEQARAELEALAAAKEAWDARHRRSGTRDVA